MSFFDNRMKQLRVVAWLEGLSFLFLLFVAMPMKYIGGEPALVRSAGLVHGLLFALFVLTALQAKVEHAWGGSRMMRVIGTAFLPFGMIVFDRMTRSPENRE